MVRPDAAAGVAAPISTPPPRGLPRPHVSRPPRVSEDPAGGSASAIPRGPASGQWRADPRAARRSPRQGVEMRPPLDIRLTPEVTAGPSPRSASPARAVRIAQGSVRIPCRLSTAPPAAYITAMVLDLLRRLTAPAQAPPYDDARTALAPSGCASPVRRRLRRRRDDQTTASLAHPLRLTEAGPGASGPRPKSWKRRPPTPVALHPCHQGGRPHEARVHVIEALWFVVWPTANATTKRDAIAAHLSRRCWASTTAIRTSPRERVEGRPFTGRLTGRA